MPKGDPVLTHSPTINIPVKDIQIGVHSSNRVWWGWKQYYETWRQLDIDPKTPHDKLALYPVMKRHFKNRRWTDSALQGQMTRTVALYLKVKAEGFSDKVEKKIRVKINGDGAVELCDGHHRVSMLRYWGMEDEVINVVVQKREARWLGLKETAYNLYGRKFLYQPISHPDFWDWKIDRVCDDRLNIISSLTLKGKTVLDIGSCTGYVSQIVSKLGAVVTGIERNDKRVYIANYMNNYLKLEHPPAFICSSFENHLNQTRRHYDLCLFLSVFHHYLRTKPPEEAWRAIELISRHCDMLVMDVGLYELKSPWSPERVLKHSKYTGYVKHEGEERPVYVFK